MSQAQPVGFNMVKRLAKAHYPWYFYIENEKGSSNKFWSAKGSWENNPVEITWGRIGSKGTTITKPFSYFVKVAQKKLAKGYTYAVSDFLKEGLIEHGDKLLTYLTGWLLDFEATSPIITQELDSIGLQVAKAKWLLESEKVYKDIKHYVSELSRLLKVGQSKKAFSFDWIGLSSKKSSVIEKVESLSLDYFDLIMGMATLPRFFPQRDPQEHRDVSVWHELYGVMYDYFTLYYRKEGFKFTEVIKAIKSDSISKKVASNAVLVDLRGMFYEGASQREVTLYIDAMFRDRGWNRSLFYLIVDLLDTHFGSLSFMRRLDCLGFGYDLWILHEVNDNDALLESFEELADRVGMRDAYLVVNHPTRMVYFDAVGEGQICQAAMFYHSGLIPTLRIRVSAKQSEPMRQTTHQLEQSGDSLKRFFNSFESRVDKIFKGVDI